MYFKEKETEMPYMQPVSLHELNEVDSWAQLFKDLV